MARRKKPNTQQVRKVRKKAQQDDLSFGRSTLPEDVRKQPKRKAKQKEIEKTRKRINSEEQEVRKGRAPAKEKEIKTPANRHAPRKSEIEKEFTHELQKIRNRLKYRERQGFFVKWETLPTRPSNITQSDIEKLKQYEVQMNELDEIGVVRTEYNEYAREMSQKLRVKYKDTPNYRIENDPHFVPPMESVQNFEIFDVVEAKLIYAYSLVQNEGTILEHPLNEELWIQLSNDVEEAYSEAIKTFRETRDSPKRQEYADYLTANKDIILDAIDVLLEVSDDDQLRQAKSELLRYLELH